MSVATLTSKGQITLPKDIRELLGLVEGDKIDFIVGDKKEVRIRPMNKSLWDLKGMLKRPGQKPATLADMKRAIIAGASRHF